MGCEQAASACPAAQRAARSACSGRVASAGTELHSPASQRQAAGDGDTALDRSLLTPAHAAMVVGLADVVFSREVGVDILLGALCWPSRYAVLRHVVPCCATLCLERRTAGGHPRAPAAPACTHLPSKHSPACAVMRTRRPPPAAGYLRFWTRGDPWGANPSSTDIEPLLRKFKAEWNANMQVGWCRARPPPACCPAHPEHSACKLPLCRCTPCLPAAGRALHSRCGAA